MKYILVLCTLFVTWLVLSLADLRRVPESTTQPRIPNYSWGEMSDIFAREKELEDELTKIQLHHKNQRAILDRLSTEHLSLRNAATSLDTQARGNHPRIQAMLEERYPALSSVERMALYLLEQLENDGGPPEVIEHLCCEMTTWSEAAPTLFRQPRPLKPR